MAKIFRKIYDNTFAGLLRPTLVKELRVQPGLAGFFGQVFTSINGIRLAEIRKMRASVYWGTSSPYFEESRGPNAWANFVWTPNFDFTGGRMANGLKLPYRPGAHDFLPYEGRTVRQSVERAIQEWCQPRPEITQEVSSFSERHFMPGRMLGVHVRLTDVAAGAEGRRIVGLDNIMAAVDDWCAANQEGRIYLASDDQRVVTAFTKRFPGRVAFQNCLRSDDGTSIHGHYDDGVAGSPYQKGREVLIDALLLAQCDHLIRTHSRVTAFSLCWNPKLTCQDLEREILGIDRTPWLHDRP